IEGIYIVKKLEIRPKLYSFDKPVFMESLRYSMLMLVQTLVIQFNGHVDNILIGAYIGAASVSVYSIGLQLYNMFEQFAMAFSNLMLPTVTQQIVQNNTNTQLEDTVIKVGRFQFIFLGAVLCGFIILGKEFITLWVGEEFLDAWKVGVILMVPTMIPLIQNVCLAILRAKNKLAFRTTMVSVMAVINLVITYIGTKYFESYIYAAIGTAVSLVVANVIAMNIYYYAVLKINVFRIFKNVLSRNWLCVIVPTLAVLYIKKFFAVSILSFVTLIVIFVIIYAILLWFIGLNDSEKNMIKRIVKK
ncbi:MAG: oligosaccharide flippase family protein, partial [Clostridia bacterium]|nr:oligosaccharide flippase family protein [Clostridia bacterium]